MDHVDQGQGRTLPGLCRPGSPGLSASGRRSADQAIAQAFHIAEHACLKYSGRIGRSEAAKSLDEDAVRLAVLAHIRHAETQYDALLAAGCERWEARAQVQDDVAQVLSQWEVQE